MRELLLYIEYLPEDSLLKQYLRNDPLTGDQKLLLTIVDVLNQVAFESRIGAMAGAGKSYSRVNQHRPKAIERPTIIPIPKKRIFLKASDLKRMLEKRTVNHTPECVASQVNKGGGKLRCSCP